MSTPGPWLDPPADSVRTGELVRIQANGDLSGLTGLAYADGGAQFSSGLPDVATGGSQSLEKRAFGVAGVRVPQVLMGSTAPEEWGSVRPAGAVAFQWETPTAPAVPGVTSMPGVSPVAPLTVRSEVYVTPSSAPRAEFSWTIRTGRLPLDGITTSGPSVTSAPGLTGPFQFAEVDRFTVPAGTGSALVTHETDHAVTVPSGGQAGWAVFLASADDALATEPPTGYLSAAGIVAAHRTSSTPYQPTSRYRWLYATPAPAGASYGWGVRLA